MLDLENLKASDVLQAMVTGLQNSKKDSAFNVEMDTYGYIKNKLCYGCAATVTLVEMFGEGQLASEIMLGYAKTPSEQSNYAYAFLSEVIRSKPSGSQDSLPINLKKLENAVEEARRGYVSWLIYFLTGKQDDSFNGRWFLRNYDWEEKLPVVKATIAEMIAAGY